MSKQLCEHKFYEAGITLIKYYLDISKDEQKNRLQARRGDPLKQWKLSPLDKKAVQLFEDYSLARDEMLARSHTKHAPWTIVRADIKKTARLNVLRDILHRVPYEGSKGDKSAKRSGGTVTQPNRDVVFTYEDVYSRPGLLAR